MDENDVIKDVPPNFEEICAVFPHARDHKGAIFTYGGNIYAPHLEEGMTLPAHLLIHETVHKTQQEAYEGGAAAWWARYLTDTNFRAGQEIEAYRAQYHFVLTNHGGQRKHVEDFLFKISCDLSGELYGNIMSYGRAESNIRRKE